MTANQFVRGIIRVNNAMERDAKRRQKDLELKKKAYTKMQVLEQATYEVEEFQNTIEILTSLHKEYRNRIDWAKIAISKEPSKPINQKKYEKKAQAALDNYKPNFFIKIFKQEEKQINALQHKLEEAIAKDTREYRDEVEEWAQEVEEWKNQVETAEAILKNDSEIKLKVIKEFNSFSEISNIGSEISIVINEDNIPEVNLYVHSTAIIPSEIKSLLKSGKLSTKEMPKTQFNTIYQDYVCSAILRIANELFSIIPDKFIIVNALDNILNTHNGHLEKLPIVSAYVSRETLDSLNLELIDPSNAMYNFIHNMSFKKTNGFSAVDLIKINK